MIRSLRNKHRQAWLSIALLLPIGIIFSWLTIPNPIPVKVLPAISLLPEIKGKQETTRYCINIRCNTEKTAWQLEWKNRLALTTPSAVIYRAGNGSNKIDSAKLVGRIEARGDYAFVLEPVKDSILYLFVYDFIHGKIIDSANIKIL